MKTEHLDWLAVNNAWGGSIEWIEKNKIATLEDAWKVCDRADWLLWMASKLGVDKRKLTMCGALCAHTVVQHMEDPRSRNAVRVAFLFGRGKATVEELEKARIAASAADDTWYSDTWCSNIASRAAANAAWHSAASYITATSTSAWASSAAYFSARADADADAAKKENQRKTAEIAKKMLTDEVLEKIKEIK